MKCLAICFGVNIEKNIPVFFGAFYKFLYHCQKNDWPILAQEEYFENPEKQEKKYPIKLADVEKINDISDIKKIKIKPKNKYVITKKETQSFLRNYANKDEAWINLMYKVDDTLTDILDKKMKIIVKKNSDLKYVVVWRYNATIDKLCQKYQLQMINMEMSGFRKPSYNFTLCYFQHTSKYNDEEFNERYKKFMSEIKSKKVKMLNRDQLIKLMVSENELNNMVEEQYYTGFAMGLAKDYDTISTKSKTNDEILEELSSQEKNNSILIRKHPANYHYIYNHEDEFTLDHSISSIQFLSKCHRIVSSVSNIGSEAMLFGKTCYILGEMPFKKLGYQSLEYNDEYVINVQDLAFLIFCFFVPYEIALTKEYIEFRDSNPTEIEIYEYHFNYIMKKYGKNLLKEGQKCISEKWTEKYENEQALKAHCAELESQLDLMINSKSWKMTKPLRRIMDIFR